MARLVGEIVVNAKRGNPEKTKVKEEIAVVRINQPAEGARSHQYIGATESDRENHQATRVWLPLAQAWDKTNSLSIRLPLLHEYCRGRFLAAREKAGRNKG